MSCLPLVIGRFSGLLIVTIKDLVEPLDWISFGLVFGLVACAALPFPGFRLFLISRRVWVW